MKKKLLIPIFMLILGISIFLNGCKKKPPEIDMDPAPPANGEEIGEVEDDEKVKIMDEFLEMVNGQDSLMIKEYIDENIGKVSQLEGNEMIDHFEKSLNNNLYSLESRLLSLDKDMELLKISDEFFFPIDKINKIKNEDLKREVVTLFDTKYKLINIEGAFYPIIDYKGLQDEYNNFVTDEWKEYLAVKAMDSNNPPFIDGALRIGYDDLANRILKTENYLNKYLDSARHEEMLDSYHNKITLYLKGVDNTPIANANTKKIYDDIMVSYTNTSYQEGYITANILSKYVEAIKDNNNIIDNKVLSIADELIDEAVEFLREYK